MTTQIDKAIAYIKLKGAARSDALAEHLGVKLSLISALLNAPCKDGRLVSCSIERPGKPKINEYRIGCGQAPRHDDFVRRPPARATTPARRAETKPAVSETKPREAETKTAIRETPPPAAVTPTPAPAPTAKPLHTDRQLFTPADLVVALNSKGEMALSFDHVDIKLTPALARELGEFFFATEPAWR